MMYISFPLECILDSLVIFFILILYSSFGLKFKNINYFKIIINSVFWGFMGIIFDDFSYVLFLSCFIIYEFIKNKDWLQSADFINPFIFSVLLEVIIYISSGFIGRAVRYSFFRNYHGTVGNNLISVFSLIINAIIVGTIIIVLKENSLKITEIQNKISSLKLENQIFWMLLSLFISFELILFIGDFEGITIFIQGTLLVMYTSFLFLMIWQMINLIRVFSARQKMGDERKQNEQLSEYLENIQEQYDDLRKFKHDFKNIVLSMNVRSNEDVDDSYEKLYKELSQQKEFNSDLEGKIISEYKLINNEPLKGLIIQKFFKAKSNQVKLNVEIFESVNITDDVLDIIRIVGILLDNAIEETIKCQDKNISLAFIKNDNNLEISIENPLSHSIDIRKIFEEGYSTKGTGRGTGLANVSNIVDGKSNLYLDTEIVKNHFRITLIILEGR